MRIPTLKRTRQTGISAFENSGVCQKPGLLFWTLLMPNFRVQSNRLLLAACEPLLARFLLYADIGNIECLQRAIAQRRCSDCGNGRRLRSCLLVYYQECAPDATTRE